MSDDGTAAALESFIRHHTDLAKHALRILLQEGLDSDARAPIVAAAIYSCDDADLIHDGFPVYGLIDDLFILAIALDATLTTVGDRVASVAKAKVGDETLTEHLGRMKRRFGGFWSYCKTNTGEFFAKIRADLPGDDSLVDRTRDWFTDGLPKVTHLTRKVKGTLEDAEVERFLATYTL